jgi:ketosteroid isomerase-like protein
MNDIEQNRSISQELIRAFGRLDLSQVCEIVSPDADWWVVGQETAKRDTVLKSFQNLPSGRAISGQVEILDTIAEGDKVMIEWRGALEFADGRTYRNEYTWIVTFQNSRVTKIRVYNNMDKVRTFFQIA